MIVAKGGFPQQVSFITKDGNQTFEELGDGIKTVVLTRDNLYRRAVIRKLDKKKEVFRILFRRGIYANTDTIVYAAADQDWPLAAREEKEEVKCTIELSVGDQIQPIDIEDNFWEVVEVTQAEGVHDVWSVEVMDGDSFALRNTIPTMSVKTGGTK